MITAINKGHPITVVAFSGCAPKNSMFEWVKTFTGRDCNFVGVMDPVHDWYQSSKYRIAADVGQAITGKRCLCIGASAGGFGALMFGKLLGADAILAFCPQSACGDAKRALGDDRWPKWCLTTPNHDIGGEYPKAIVH